MFLWLLIPIVVWMVAGGVVAHLSIEQADREVKPDPVFWFGVYIMAAVAGPLLLLLADIRRQIRENNHRENRE